jgi:hypothetical protein
LPATTASARPWWCATAAACLPAPENELPRFEELPMQTHVYANGLEIAAKAVGQQGVSPAAFPDPCWSPPAPAAGPVVIPYPNTCYAASITNGTRTVFICGKESAIEDQSYFGTSVGNEPATQAFAKGVATGVITGKAYFTQWSFDVVFEGFGVPRHTDMVTHNHGSMPANTALFPYVSRGIFGHDCKKEEERVKRACDKESERSDSRKGVRSKSKALALLRSKRNSGAGGKAKKNWHWKDDHCDGLDVMLGSKTDAVAYAKQMEEAFKKLPDELNILGALESELRDMATKAGAKALAKWAAKAGAKQLAGSTLPAIGNALMAIWSVADAAVAIGDVNEIRNVAIESLRQLDVLKSKIGDLSSLAKEFDDFNKLSPQEQLEKAQSLGAKGQDILATLNECTRARKCMLVPYGSDKAQRGREHSKGKGCCTGQTGHHLIPGGSIEKACPGYDHDDAPTVCVEGATQNLGSHKRAHEALATEHQLLAKSGRVDANSTMSMSDAIDSAADSHEKTFPLSRCSKKCIKAQLESYYNSKCSGVRAGAVNAQAKLIGPTPLPGGGPN